MQARHVVAIALALALPGGASAQQAARSGKPLAKAQIEPKSGSKATGTASFNDDGKGGLVLVVDMKDLPPGERAVHIHAKGDCSSPDGKSAGDHWNPTQAPHGKWGAAGDHYHLGDIGNINVGPDGKGTVTLDTTKWTVGTGAANDVVGKSIVVHGGVDDFKSQPAGNAGARIGCGVIEAVSKK